MAGKKRSSEDAGVTTRGSTKAARKDGDATPAKDSKGSPSSKGGKKGGPKSTMAGAEFKKRALPLHMNITHTPPALSDDKNTVPAAEVDPGFIGTTALTPSVFSTGSYGWKGSKRITIEIDDPEGGDKKEKVQVMLSINATVLGSKPAKGGDKNVEEEEEAAEDNDD